VKNPLGTKLYYSISEVAKITDLQPYTLRAWEKEFPCLRPRRARGKNRAYRERDISIILLIKELLYRERYTTQGVKQKLKNEPELLRNAINNAALVQRLTEEKEGKKAPSGTRLAPGQRDSLQEKGKELNGDAAGGEGKVAQADLLALVEETRKELKEIIQLL